MTEEGDVIHQQEEEISISIVGFARIEKERITAMIMLVVVEGTRSDFNFLDCLL